MGRIVINSAQYEPKPIVGYADQVSAAPGDTVRFMVSCDGAPSFQAQLVRLIHGDLHGDGPGFKETEIDDATLNGRHRGRKQDTYPGSYTRIPASPDLDSLQSLTLQVHVWATTPEADREQAIMAKWSDDEERGWALFLRPDGRLAFKCGTGASVETIEAGAPLVTGLWYSITLTFDGTGRTVRLVQRALPGSYNSRLAFRDPSGAFDARSDAQFTAELPATVGIPLTLAAWSQIRLGSGREVAAAFFNGKLDRPRIASRAVAMEDAVAMVHNPTLVGDVLAAWDFGLNITSQGIRDFATIYDVTTNRRHGELINMPMRGATGHNWDSTEHCYRHAPGQYGAIHFHDDDLVDCRWEPTITWTVPPELPSGVYALRVRAVIQDTDEEDYLVFFVRPPAGVRRAKIAYIAPTASYLAYANDQMAADVAFIEMLAGAVPHMGEHDLARHQHREYGSSMYDVHNDGSGVCYSSWLRPLLTVRPKYRHSASRVWQFNADLHLIDWFDRFGFEVDVVTDHDLEREGLGLLRGYKVAVTGSHPEYYSGSMLDSLHAFVESEGGRVMYLGGNGFYWVTAFSPEDSRVVEVRRTHGTEAWSGEPGQHHLSFTGELGGLWRHRGRAPQKLVGVGFVAQGLDVSTYFLRKPDSKLAHTSWIFDGVDYDEKIGDFGLEQGGAAGVEIDWYDPRLGSPGWAAIVAASEGHSRLMLEVRENSGMTLPYMGGDMDPNVRADMVYFKSASDGAVFSTSSISWCGSLSHNDYKNNVSLIMENVVSRFVSDEPLP